MKPVGKIAVLAMALALAGALVACGGSSSSGSASASSASASASASAASASASVESASASASSAEAEFEVGVSEADTYTNEFFDMKFELPDGFSFQDADYLAKLNASVGEALDDKAVTEALESGAAFFDMAAVSENGDNVTVVIEYAGSPEAAAIDAAAYLAYTKEQLGPQLEKNGTTVKNAELGKFTNGTTGDEFDALKLELEVSGTPLYEELIVVKEGNYFMTVTATSSDEARLDAMLESLTRLK